MCQPELMGVGSESVAGVKEGEGGTTTRETMNEGGRGEGGEVKWTVFGQRWWSFPYWDRFLGYDPGLPWVGRRHSLLDVFL